MCFWKIGGKPGACAEDKPWTTILRIEVETVEGWRTKGNGPRYLKLGKREIRYRPSEVLR